MWGVCREWCVGNQCKVQFRVTVCGCVGGGGGKGDVVGGQAGGFGLAA